MPRCAGRMPPGGGPVKGIWHRAVDTLFHIHPMLLFAFPFMTLTMEKTTYDTFQAYRGHNIYEEGSEDQRRAHGGKAAPSFPSGGSQVFGSFSLIDPITDPEKRPSWAVWVNSYLGDPLEDKQQLQAVAVGGSQ